MRYILYFLLFAQAAIIIYLTSTMVDRAFNNSDMRISYYQGCNLGQLYAESLKFTCSSAADSFKEELDRLDILFDQMGE